ncbi:hypothetical protein L1987_37700 [Smallanthus sonchifolius]|uniref:Uncharacterized protein n=1 Tax=Smallanthus sonchifolius TaxID=185202 RepID=A0ACB9HIG0_9ASTR|nr:hypothetical protein L1987_37700 [Smallanthus sonchifolius]
MVELVAQFLQLGLGLELELRGLGTEDGPHDEDDGADDDDAADEGGEEAAEEGGALWIGVGRVSGDVEVCGGVGWWVGGVRVRVTVGSRLSGVTVGSRLSGVTVGSRLSGVAGDGRGVIRHCKWGFEKVRRWVI